MRLAGSCGFDGGAFFFCFVLFTLLFIFKAFMNLTSSISFGQDNCEAIMRTVENKHNPNNRNEGLCNTITKVNLDRVP